MTDKTQDPESPCCENCAANGENRPGERREAVLAIVASAHEMFHPSRVKENGGVIIHPDECHPKMEVDMAIVVAPLDAEEARETVARIPPEAIRVQIGTGSTERPVPGLTYVRAESDEHAEAVALGVTAGLGVPGIIGISMADVLVVLGNQAPGFTIYVAPCERPIEHLLDRLKADRRVSTQPGGIFLHARGGTGLSLATITEEGSAIERLIHADTNMIFSVSFDEGIPPEQHELSFVFTAQRTALV